LVNTLSDKETTAAVNESITSTALHQSDQSRRSSRRRLRRISPVRFSALTSGNDSSIVLIGRS